MSNPNPFNTSRNVGVQAGQSNRALVVNVMDPLKSGRVQIRVVGHMDDEQSIPDDKLPWVKIRNGTNTSSLQTSTTTHGLLPGSMVTCEAMGEGGQDWLVTGTIPNDRKDDQQSIHPATQGKGDTDNFFSDTRETSNWGWSGGTSNVYNNKTTQGAKKIRDETGRKKQRSEDPIKKSHDKDLIPDHYGKRATSKDSKGGTIGVFKFQGKDAQSFIKQTIQNKSAIVPNALSALQNLKKVTSNPTSIQSIGTQNYTQILQQLSKWFKSNSKSKQEQQQFDCEFLLKTADELLNSELLAAKKICLILEELKDTDENA